MAVEAELVSVDSDPADHVDRARVTRASLGASHRPLAVVAVAVAVSPIVVAAVALVGETWAPMSDWSSMLYRVSQVGTRETPLVGPYSFHGFAHPGPLLYWVTAPVYRLTGEDPRSILWAGGLVNLLAIGGLAAVAWRRGRWPLLLATTTLVAALVHGFGPNVTVDAWNPHVSLLPFLLTIFLVWDAGLGRRRALLIAAVPASFAVQAHLAFVFLTALVVVWLVAWNLWKRRVMPDLPPDDEPDTRWAALRRPLLVVVGLLWLAPLVDAAVDLHNPVNIARSALINEDTVGPIDAVSMVGQHVRLDGRWIVGEGSLFYEPTFSIGNSLHLLVVVALVAGCLQVARRRRLPDVAALATLSATLLVGSVPAASQLITPTNSYLTEWLKVVGGLAWFTVAWTGWRLAQPAIQAVPLRRRVAGAAAGVALVGVTAWSWPDATELSPPHNEGADTIVAFRSALDRELPRDQRYRVEVVGDPTSHFTGLIYWMIHDGYDVLTKDGDRGLKWGHAHRWNPGDSYDAYLTVAVRSPNWEPTAYERCHDDSRYREVVGYDGLTAEERAWLDEIGWRMLGGPGALSDEESRRAADLGPRDVRISVFEGPGRCGL